MDGITGAARSKADPFLDISAGVVVMDVIVGGWAYVGATTVLKPDTIWVAGAVIVMNVVPAALFLQADASASIVEDIVPTDIVAISLMVQQDAAATTGDGIVGDGVVVRFNADAWMAWTYFNGANFEVIDCDPVGSNSDGPTVRPRAIYNRLPAA